MNSENEIVIVKSRLPVPNGLGESDAGKWRVLCESIFPTARTPEAILLAMDYCRARNLDIMKKPVHIVPMWSSSLGREVETVWPSIAEVQITASRTGKYAGMDEPKWGQDITRTFKGVKPKAVGETEITLTFPESCAVTVYRMVDGVRCAFTEPVYWLEAYARIGKTELPNDQWAKRTRGMIIKVAKAFSLRAAFPEEGTYTAEEMEGKVVEEVDSTGNIVDVSKPLKKANVFKTHALRNEYCKNIAAAFESAISVAELDTAAALYKEKLTGMRESESEYENMEAESLGQLYLRCKNRILEADEQAEAGNAELDEQFRNAMQ